MIHQNGETVWKKFKNIFFFKYKSMIQTKTRTRTKRVTFFNKQKINYKKQEKKKFKQILFLNSLKEKKIHYKPSSCV